MRDEKVKLFDVMEFILIVFGVAMLIHDIQSGDLFGIVLDLIIIGTGFVINIGNIKKSEGGKSEESEEGNP